MLSSDTPFSYSLFPGTLAEGGLVFSPPHTAGLLEAPSSGVQMDHSIFAKAQLQGPGVLLSAPLCCQHLLHYDEILIKNIILKVLCCHPDQSYK